MINTARWPQEKRLRRREDFQKVQTKGVVDRRRFFLVLTLQTDTRNAARVGLTVSKKVGNAVVRNTVRRRLRDICRRFYFMLPKGVELVVIAKTDAVKGEFRALEKDIRAAFSKLAESSRP